MKTNGHAHNGIESLINKYRRIFRVPENLNYYSEEDYKMAEKLFIKWVLQNGGY